MLSVLTMIRLLLITLIGIATATTAFGQSSGGAGLELTTEVIGQRYCTGDADLDGVSLNLRLLYRNTGTSPLILYKGSSTVYEVVVRKTSDGPFELQSQLSWYSDKPWNVDASSLSKLFVILRPNATFETHTETRVFVTRDDSQHFQGSVPSGEHYLQVTIPTWHGSQELADAMQRKWRSNGFLWRRAVTSAPIKFTVAKNRTVSECP